MKSHHKGTKTPGRDAGTLPKKNKKDLTRSRRDAEKTKNQEDISPQRHKEREEIYPKITQFYTDKEKTQESPTYVPV
jgi:hypothetical protein